MTIRYVNSDRESSNYAPVKDAHDEEMATRSPQAILVFANPVAIDCQRRKWSRSFQRLFDTDRLVGLATPETDVHIFTSMAPGLSRGNLYTVHVQRYTGAGFGERLQDAVDCLTGLGYCKIVIIGSDCPSLTAGDILKAFKLLDDKRLVLGPDHRGGCYLIGLHGGDRVPLAQIRWHQNTDCAELLNRCGENVTAQLPVKIDLDTLEDLRLLARAESCWKAMALALLQSLNFIYPEVNGTPHRNANKHQILAWQLPPPSLSISR